MFTGPEYASYRQLCRELWEPRVPGPGWYPHEFTFGDVFTDDRNPEPVWYGEEFTREDHEGATWLPRSDQLDDLLEEAGMDVVEIEHRGDRYIASAAAEAQDCEWSCHPDATCQGQTREEAKLRLWCAVTGRAVTA